MKLSVLLPVYNECATLRELVARVVAVPLDKEIIIVDNASTDGTREVLLEMLARGEAVRAEDFSDFDNESALEDARRIRIALQSENGGKGKSVRRALELSRGEWIIVQDADLEYDPRDYLKLLEIAERYEEKMARYSRQATRDVAVFGTRLKHGTRARKDQPRGAFFYGRVGLSAAFRVLYGTPLSDVATCYKLMRRRTALSLDLKSSGFDLDFEIAARLRRRGVRILETPIFYDPRGTGDGKKIRAVQDGARALFTLVRYRF